jgi:hypothetical protein
MRRGILGRSLWGAAMLGSWVMSQGVRGAPPPVTSGERFPFAWAVLAGALAVLWVRV